MKTKIATCVWCGNKGKKTFHARITWENLDSSWYKCSNCKSLMILPLPSKKAISDVYENDYMNKRLQPHEGVDCRIRYSKEYRPVVFSEYAMSLEDCRIKKNEIKSILDFGCADGLFLDFCKKYFNSKTKLWGTDLSEDLLSQARKNGWDVFPLGDTENIKMKFDLITLWDVIEHVEDPLEVMKMLKKLLTPKGRIFLETPRFGLLGELYGDNWPHLLPVQHLGIATKEGMEKLAKRAGLVIDAHVSFGSNSPAHLVPQPYKKIYDTLAKKLDFGDVQLASFKSL